MTNNVRLQNQKLKAKQWAENMGIVPRKTSSGKAIWDSQFIDNSGNIGTRQKTVNHKYNDRASLHIPTTGIGVTKKVVKEIKRNYHKVVKIKQGGVREIPQHYLDMVTRSHMERNNQ